MAMIKINKCDVRSSHPSASRADRGDRGRLRGDGARLHDRGPVERGLILWPWIVGPI